MIRSIPSDPCTMATLFFVYSRRLRTDGYLVWGFTPDLDSAVALVDEAFRQNYPRVAIQRLSVPGVFDPTLRDDRVRVWANIDGRSCAFASTAPLLEGLSIDDDPHYEGTETDELWDDPAYRPTSDLYMVFRPPSHEPTSRFMIPNQFGYLRDIEPETLLDTEWDYHTYRIRDYIADHPVETPTPEPTRPRVRRSTRLRGRTPEPEPEPEPEPPTPQQYTTRVQVRSIVYYFGRLIEDEVITERRGVVSSFT